MGRLLPSYKKGLYQAGYVTAFLLVVVGLEIWRPHGRFGDESCSGDSRTGS